MWLILINKFNNLGLAVKYEAVLVAEIAFAGIVQLAPYNSFEM
jgi:hypothetical protein